MPVQNNSSGDSVRERQDILSDFRIENQSSFFVLFLLFTIEILISGLCARDFEHVISDT